MKRTGKPVRKCYKCLLNLGDQCWLYAYPRGQWRGKRCTGFENEAAYEEYRRWLKDPVILTRRELRKAAFRSR